MAKKIIIAIDGYSGTGKSSTAKALARKLGYIYIDSGAMYRAATLFFMKNNIDVQNATEVSEQLQKLHVSFLKSSDTMQQETYLDGINVEKDIRSVEVSNRVSEVSKLDVVRAKMVEQQRVLGAQKGVVMDGRDIGTVVFPNAEFKVFMTADMNVRAKRRKAELEANQISASLGQVAENLALRDEIDTSRENSPLKKADGAYLLDTTNITFEEQVKVLYDRAQKLITGDHA